MTSAPHSSGSSAALPLHPPRVPEHADHPVTGAALLTEIKRGTAHWRHLRLMLHPEPDHATRIQVINAGGEVDLRLSSGGHLTQNHAGWCTPFEVRQARDGLAPFGVFASYAPEALGPTWQQAIVLGTRGEMGSEVLVASPVEYPGGWLVCGRGPQSAEVFTLWVTPNNQGAKVDLRLWKRGHVITERSKSLPRYPRPLLF